MADDAAVRAIASLSLAGRVEGEVRRLAGFDKKRHVVPDQVNGATSGFLAKLSEGALLEEAEELFQAARRAFGYKRKEIALAAGAGFARLEAKEFTLELRYALLEEDPSRYFVESELVSVSSKDLLGSDPLNVALGARFDRLRCGLSQGVSVEAVIDAIEEDRSGEMEVDYPSDCSECLVRLAGVPGEIMIDGALFELRFGRLVRAGDLLEAFEGAAGRFQGGSLARALIGGLA